MRFTEVFRFELSYQTRQPWPWLIFLSLIVFGFLFVRVNYIADAVYADFALNTPFLIAGATVFGGLIWLVAGAAIAGEAAARDRASAMHPLIYSAPISKMQYLGGRFAATVVINAVILLGVQTGIACGYHLPGVTPGVIGPFQPMAYLTAYAFIALPNAFFASAIQFAIALRNGRAMSAYIGSFLLLFMGFFIASAVLFHYSWGKYLDPVGIRFIVEELARLWTTTEKATRLLSFEGQILANRALWLTVGLAVLTYAYGAFRFAHPVQREFGLKFRVLKFPMLFRSDKRRKLTIQSEGEKFETAPVSSGLSTVPRQIFTIAAASFRSVAGSPAGLGMLIGIPLLTIPVVIDQMSWGGAQLAPTTIRVITELIAPLADELSRWVIVPGLIIFFAGELVWRERDARVAEITDAFPGSEWTPLLGKFLGISVLLAVFTASQTGAGILAQLLMGFENIELALYVKIMFGLQLTEYLLFALIVLIVHAVVNHKYLGHLIAVTIFVYIAMSPMFGIEHNLLVFGAGPHWSYTDMRGFGSSLLPWLWFKLYWIAWAILFAVSGRLMWVRGRENSLLARLHSARLRLRDTTLWLGGAAIVSIFVIGGFIFYNTNILNEYLSTGDMKERQAEYERRYGHYKDAPEPQLVATKLHIEIYPREQRVEIKGLYSLVNRNAVPVDSIHITTSHAAKTGYIRFGRSASRVLADEKLGHEVHTLRDPLQPGDTLELEFQVYKEPRGFREGGVDLSVTANATSFDGSWVPAVGYDAGRELISPTDRARYGLPARPLIASLYDQSATTARGGGIMFEALIGTSEDQVAVAPGALMRTWVDDQEHPGRRYFLYSTDAAIGGEWSIQSADYAIHETRWQHDGDTGTGVDVKIFHHPKHTAHLKRVVRGIQASLDYYSTAFGPYPYGHLSIVERPGNGAGMHAEPAMIVHGEGFPMWDPNGDGGLDLPSAVVAHEIAHQWTVPYANVEGAPVMSESVAWYYGMKAVEKAYGEQQLLELRRFMRQPYPYPPIRRGEPLLRGLDPYLSYRRGPFALYTLSEYVGEANVNLALRRLLEHHRSENAPLATTLDLYRELKTVTPDTLQYLLHDLFEVNTYWNLRVGEATAQKLESGMWQVAVDVSASKHVADSAGVESEVPMRDWVEIGVFGRGAGGAIGKPLHVAKYQLSSGNAKLIIVVNEAPAYAGIDPNFLLIDLNTGDNLRAIRDLKE